MNYNDINIEKARQGEEAAWKDVYDCFWRKLVYYCLKVNPEMVQLDAEEIAEEAILAVYKNRAHIESPKHLNNTLYLAVKRLSFTKHRTDSHVKAREQEFHYLYEKDDNPIGDIDLDRVLTELIAYVASLPEEMQKALMARITDPRNKLPHSNVHYLLVCRARKRVKEYFKKHHLLTG